MAKAVTHDEQGIGAGQCRAREYLAQIRERQCVDAGARRAPDEQQRPQQPRRVVAPGEKASGRAEDHAQHQEQNALAHPVREHAEWDLRQHASGIEYAGQQQSLGRRAPLLQRIDRQQGPDARIDGSGGEHGREQHGCQCEVPPLAPAAVGRDGRQAIAHGIECDARQEDGDGDDHEWPRALEIEHGKQQRPHHESDHEQHGVDTEIEPAPLGLHGCVDPGLAQDPVEAAAKADQEPQHEPRHARREDGHQHQADDDEPEAAEDGGQQSDGAQDAGQQRRDGNGGQRRGDRDHADQGRRDAAPLQEHRDQRHQRSPGEPGRGHARQHADKGPRVAGGGRDVARLGGSSGLVAHGDQLSSAKTRRQHRHDGGSMPLRIRSRGLLSIMPGPCALERTGRSQWPEGAPSPGNCAVSMTDCLHDRGGARGTAARSTAAQGRR